MNKYISTTELAKLLHISRIAIFKKIKSGKIKAVKVGRNYVIPHEEALAAMGAFISAEKKDLINRVVKDAVHEYGETFRLLGKE
jgi:excisionase family DNA binding protein